MQAGSPDCAVSSRGRMHPPSPGYLSPDYESGPKIWEIVLSSIGYVGNGP